MASSLLWRALAWILSRPAIAAWLIARAHRTPYWHIPEDGSYMERYWLFNPYAIDEKCPLRRFKWCPISVRLHVIKRPDRDRHLHDHPWNARTIILRGGYTEQREDGDWHVRLPGDTATLRFGEFHRIAALYPDATTLFITGRKRGTWGFKVDGAKVPHREYLGYASGSES